MWNEEREVGLEQRLDLGRKGQRVDGGKKKRRSGGRKEGRVQRFGRTNGPTGGLHEGGRHGGREFVPNWINWRSD